MVNSHLLGNSQEGHAHFRPWENLAENIYSVYRHNGTPWYSILTREIDCNGLFWRQTFTCIIMITPISDRGKILTKIWQAEGSFSSSMYSLCPLIYDYYKVLIKPWVYVNLVWLNGFDGIHIVMNVAELS